LKSRVAEELCISSDSPNSTVSNSYPIRCLVVKDSAVPPSWLKCSSVKHLVVVGTIIYNTDESKRKWSSLIDRLPNLIACEIIGNDGINKILIDDLKQFKLEYIKIETCKTVWSMYDPLQFNNSLQELHLTLTDTRNYAILPKSLIILCITILPSNDKLNNMYEQTYYADDCKSLERLEITMKKDSRTYCHFHSGSNSKVPDEKLETGYEPFVWH